jgi:hypothetical protein
MHWLAAARCSGDGFVKNLASWAAARAESCLVITAIDGGLETYAATLAAKTFRIIMATAARFDLEIRQFDVGNAFHYSDLKKDQPVYVQLPKGYVELGLLKLGETSTMIVERQVVSNTISRQQPLYESHINQTMDYHKADFSTLLKLSLSQALFAAGCVSKYSACISSA